MGNPLTILHLAPYYPPHMGGLQSHAGQLDQLLATQGYRIIVFAPRLPYTAPETENKTPTLIIIRYPATEIIPHYPIPAFWCPRFWRLLHTARAERPDIIISRTRFFVASLFAAILARATGTPHLHIEHGSDFPSLATPLLTAIAWLYDQTLGRLVLTVADALVANSRASANFVKKLVRRDVNIIYRGVDKDAIANIVATDLSTHYSLSARRRTRRAGGQTTNSIIITFAGRLIFGKGVADLLQAVSYLNNNSDLLLTTYYLLIIGSGPHEQELKDLTKELNLENIVTFLGEKSPEETISLVKGSDIFINPSHTEGLPTSIIEAALCKVAILATNVGGTPEIVTAEKSAILIPPKNPELLAQKLQELMNDPTLRSRLAENAYEEVSHKFSWNKSVRQYQNLFDKLAS